MMRDLYTAETEDPLYDECVELNKKMNGAIYNEEECSEQDKLIAKQEIITVLEDEYEKIDQLLNACQGCTDGLNKDLAKLRFYRNIIELLGGDIEKDKANMVDRYYKTAKKKEQAEEYFKNAKKFYDELLYF